MRQPFSVNALAQAAGAEAILHQDDVTRRVEATVAERIRVGEELRALGLLVAESQANFAWIELGEAEEARLLTGLPSGGSRSGRAAPWATPATSASPSAPPPRTTVSLPLSASCSTEEGRRLKLSATSGFRKGSRQMVIGTNEEQTRDRVRDQRIDRVVELAAPATLLGELPLGEERSRAVIAAARKSSRSSTAATSAC